jgi:general L-amino acid transport system substrate-binding protein
MRIPVILFAAFLALLFAPTPSHAGATLDAVRARGTLRCTPSIDVSGFGAPDSQGVLRGMDVDLCHAYAAAVLGDPNKVTLVPATAATRFTVLQSGDIDVLNREVTILYRRDTELGLMSGPVYMYDANSLMVPKKLGAKSIKDVDGAAICLLPGSNSETNLADYFHAHNLKYTPISIDNENALVRAFLSGRCDVITGDGSQMAADAAQSGHADDYMLLPETLSKSPLGPMVRQGDDQWLNIIRWVVYVTFLAEEKQITQANVDQVKATTHDPEVKRMLGVTPGSGKALGLSDDWAYQVIKAVGNYGEIYDRNLGEKSPLKLPRRLNRQWYDGGLIYAPPFL